MLNVTNNGINAPKKVFERPKTIQENYDYPFCAGCGHGVVLRLVAEVIDELGVQGKTIAVASVGCSISMEKFYDLDIVGSSHGRAPCVATGVKRAKPDKVVFTYQGKDRLVVRRQTFDDLIYLDVEE